MDAFERELMRRSPLAACVLEMSDHVFDDARLDAIYDEHRGRCYEDVLRFPAFVRLIRDALVRHAGSGHKLFVELERNQINPIDESNFYRKLSRTPVEVSRALLRECSMRLTELMPSSRDVCVLPACFDGFEVIAGDGKKIKNAAKRLKPTRGYSGKLLGAKALVAMHVRSGLAIAMSDSLDGEANDVPLVPALMEQLRDREVIVDRRPILSIWDRQFGDTGTLRLLGQRAGDAFVVRLRNGLNFAVESSRETRDAQGRRVIDEIGVLGTGRQAMRVRRITLVRNGEDEDEDEDDVQLVTNLTDQEQFSAHDLLALYRKRWNIESVFQQVTETFALDHLIGCAPQAILLQFALCLLMYNLVQVIKAYVAEDGRVLAGVISTFYLFDDVRQELLAWAYHTGAGDAAWPRMRRDAGQMRSRLRELLKGSWDPVAYTKASDKRPRKKRPKPLRVPGGHTSVQRLLQGKVKAHAA
jgi:hypothetical protein